MKLNPSQLEQIRYAMEAVRKGAVPPPEMDRLVLDLVTEVERLREYVGALKSENKNLQDLSDTTLHTAADAVKRVQAENAAMREIVQAMAEQQEQPFGNVRDIVLCYNDNAGELECPWCHGREISEYMRKAYFQHTADCPVTKARSLLDSSAQPGR